MWDKPHGVLHYFSKKVEEEAYKSITENQVIFFIKRCIICGIWFPYEILCGDNSQFISDKTENLYQKWGINLVKSNPDFPQANTQRWNVGCWMGRTLPYWLYIWSGGISFTNVRGWDDLQGLKHPSLETLLYVNCCDVLMYFPWL